MPDAHSQFISRYLANLRIHGLVTPHDCINIPIRNIDFMRRPDS